MSESQALRDVENSLRDFISMVLWKRFGDEWVQKCGVTEKRLEAWNGKRTEERKKLRSGITEDRLIYFSDFYDLCTIIEKNWESDFKTVFDDLATFKVFFKQLENYRNPDAHQRELMSHQKHLIIGIAGEIRNKIVEHRSRMETDDGFFPMIESVRDNFGNIWTPGRGEIKTNILLHPGDVLEFTVTATDPQDGKLFYEIDTRGWQESNMLRIEITEKNIGIPTRFLIAIKSDRAHHASRDLDHAVLFSYRIRPRRINP